MTEGHVLMAAGFTLYILVAIPFEERDMADFHGVVYEEYRSQVTVLVPGLGKIVPKKEPRQSSAEDSPAV